MVMTQLLVRAETIIKLSVSGKDDIVFESTTNNGNDTIIGFTSGANADNLNFVATLNGLGESKPAFVNTTADIADITGDGGVNTTGEAEDSVLILNVANYQFDNAAALVGGSTAGVGSTALVQPNLLLSSMGPQHLRMILG